MAFTYTVDQIDSAGLAYVTGTYTSADSSTGGAIDTGLQELKFFNTNCETSQAATVNLVAIAAGVATITTVANETGKWFAIGN